MPPNAGLHRFRWAGGAGRSRFDGGDGLDAGRCDRRLHSQRPRQSESAGGALGHVSFRRRRWRRLDLIGSGLRRPHDFDAPAWFFLRLQRGGQGEAVAVPDASERMSGRAPRLPASADSQRRVSAPCAPTSAPTLATGTSCHCSGNTVECTCRRRRRRRGTRWSRKRESGRTHGM